MAYHLLFYFRTCCQTFAKLAYNCFTKYIDKYKLINILQTEMVEINRDKYCFYGGCIKNFNHDSFLRLLFL